MPEDQGQQMADANNPTGDMIPESHGALLQADTPLPTDDSQEGGQAPATDPSGQGQEGPAPQGPKMVDIEGYGEFSMEDVQSIFEQHNEAVDALERMSALENQESELANQRKELEDLARLRDMIHDNKEIREDLEKRLPEWKQILENKRQMESPAIKAIREELSELRAFKSSIESREAEVKIQTIFEELDRQYPGVVDENFKRTVLAETLGAFQGNPGGVGPKQLFAVANATARLVGGVMQGAHKNGQQTVLRAIQSQPPGTKLVTGGAAADASATQGAERFKTVEEFAEALAERALSSG